MSRPLGYGLVVGGGLLAALMLVWLLVSGAQGGGIVLGLILLVALAGPLIGAGVYILSRGQTEAAEQAAFASRQRIIDQDRLFRRDLAAELRQLAQRPELPGDALSDLADDLSRATYDSAEWYAAVNLDDADADMLRRYDDLTWDRVRGLKSGTSGDTRQAVRELEEALDQRRDLLLRGRRAPIAAPADLMRSERGPGGATDPAAVSLGDAISFDSADYVVDALSTAFADGRSWKLARLAPAGAEGSPRWLYVGPGGLDLAVLDDADTVDGVPLESEGTATVDVAARVGDARGVLVGYRRYRGGDALGLVERWPDGTTRGYLGHLIRPSDIEVWPATVR